MRTICLSLLCTLALGFTMSSAAQAGLCLDTPFCNDYFFAFSTVESNVYELHGYEYGCGYFDRHSTGVMHLAGASPIWALSDPVGFRVLGTRGMFHTGRT